MELCFCFFSFFLEWNWIGLASGISDWQVRNEIKKEEERSALLLPFCKCSYSFRYSEARNRRSLRIDSGARVKVMAGALSDTLLN